MGKLLKFERKEEVLLIRAESTDPFPKEDFIIALQLFFVENTRDKEGGFSVINHLEFLEARGYFHFENIGEAEIFPSMKDYYFCDNLENFNKNLQLIYDKWIK